MKIKNFLLGLACAAIVFIIVFATHKKEVIFLLTTFRQWLREHPLGPILVFLLIAITAFPPTPGYSTLVIFTGYVYGMYGWFLASSAAVFGASTVFLITRKFKIGFTMDPRWMITAKVIEKKGLWFVLLLRLAPSPFNLSNVVCNLFNLFSRSNKSKVFDVCTSYIPVYDKAVNACLPRILYGL
eukprot:NODE_95_length_21460_cov_0.300220.p13 type:complete len:184 gc:universal NODE_95_length_21460_cov_0.300220:4481-5032(+)